jgi:hypothetical protein
MTVPALREFILRQGPSRNILNLEWGALWALNKKYIDPEAAVTQLSSRTTRFLAMLLELIALA